MCKKKNKVLVIPKHSGVYSSPPPPPSVAFGQHKGPHVTLHQCQPSLQQVQEPAGQHHAIRVNTSMSAAHQRGRGIRLHQRQLHRRVPVSKTHSLQKQQ